MKLKYYLRGLGTGIIFTAIILTIIYSYKMSDSKIIDRAEDMGMVMASDTKQKDSDKETPTPKETTTLEESTTPKETPTPEESTTPKEEQTPEESTTPIQSNESKTITIRRGMTSEIVAKELYEAGLIDNVDKFNNYLVNGNYAEKIRVGVYTINLNSTYEQIAKTISEK